MRTNDDSWDIATSVGATAVLVAMARAAETSSANPLIRDQFAEVLVTTPELAEVAAWWTNSEAGEANELAVSRQQLINYIAVRTRFFDAFLTAAAGAISQYVILAAGLDSRAYRMDWPIDAVIYEIDLPAVLEYKATTLNAHGAKPAATRREVGVDLRRNWSAALRAAGFDPTRATAWLAEGLLQYLPADAQEALFANIDRLSATGSRLAFNTFDGRRPEVEQQRQKLRSTRQQRSGDVSFDPAQLWYLDQENRRNVTEWLDSHGWTTQCVDSRQEAQRLGRQPPILGEQQQFLDPFVASFVTAELSALL